MVHTSRRGIVGSEKSMNQKKSLGRLASLAVALATLVVVTACRGGGSAGVAAEAETFCRRSKTGVRYGSRPTRPTRRSPSRATPAISKASIST
jgi:hypothetical protein